jgi:hypothetical protein
MQSIADYTDVAAVSILTLEGTTNASTSQSIYGVNVISISTITDFATRLPDPTTGLKTVFINNSLLSILIFPSVVGGKINGVVNGSAQIPNDGRAYTFYCTDNPLPGAWSWSSPAINQIQIGEISVAHVNGAGDTNAYNAGLGSANFASAGMGWGGSSIILTGDWRTELGSATIAKVKVYSNVLWSDLGGSSSPQSITTAMLQGYQTAASSVTFGQKQTAQFYGTSVSPGTDIQEVTGGTGTGTNVGDVGTLYMQQDGYFSYPLYQIIGNNYNQGIAGILSNGFYTFAMFIDTTAATKTYKFKWFIEYN